LIKLKQNFADFENFKMLGLV